LSVGLAITRIAPGLYLTAHGLQKASPRLGFGGISGTAEDFARSGVRGGRVPAVLTAVLQLGAGILLAIGLLIPLAAMTAVGVMIVAAQTRLRAAFWSQRGGFDSPRCWPSSAWRSSGPAAAAASVS
jgi:putative oxidoreductase